MQILIFQNNNVPEGSIYVYNIPQAIKNFFYIYMLIYKEYVSRR